MRRILVIAMWIFFAVLSVLAIVRFFRFESDIYTGGFLVGVLVAFVVGIIGLLTYKKK